MEQILFIHSDQRLDGVIPLLRHSIRDRITVAGDFDEGLRLVFEKRPTIIFIQHEIGGGSCIAVVTHIRSLLRESSPRLILLSPEKPPKFMAGRDLFDNVIPVLNDGQLLLDSIVMELRAIGRITFVEENEPEGPLSDPAGPPIELPPLGEGETFSEADKFSVPPPLEAPAGMELRFEPLDGLTADSSPPPSPEPSPPEESPPAVSPSSATLPQPPPQPLPDPFSERDRDHPFFGINREDSTELPPYDQLFSLRKERSSGVSAKRVVPLAFLLLILAGGVYYLTQRVDTPPLTGSTGGGAQTGSVNQVRPVRRPFTLPLVLNDIPIDQKAMEQKPGWEVRRSSQFSVRIYREYGVVKALQVVGLTSNGLPADLVAKLVDAAGGGFEAAARRVLEGGVSLEEKRNGEGVEMAVYRRGDTPEPVALVFSFP